MRPVWAGFSGTFSSRTRAAVGELLGQHLAEPVSGRGFKGTIERRDRDLGRPEKDPQGHQQDTAAQQQACRLHRLGRLLPPHQDGAEKERNQHPKYGV